MVCAKVCRADATAASVESRGREAGSYGPGPNTAALRASAVDLSRLSWVSMISCNSSTASVTYSAWTLSASVLSACATAATVTSSCIASNACDALEDVEVNLELRLPGVELAESRHLHLHPTLGGGETPGEFHLRGSKRLRRLDASAARRSVSDCVFFTVVSMVPSVARRARSQS